VRAYSPGRRSWGQINTLCNHLKTRFKADNKAKICLKTLYFLEKTEKIAEVLGLCPHPSVGLRRLGVPPPDPQVVTLVICSNNFKNRPIISYLNDGYWAPLAKLVPPWLKPLVMPLGLAM